MITKTKEEEQLINKFTRDMAELFMSNPQYISKKDPENNAQKLFEKIYDQISIPNGSIYLCFGCGQVLDRDEMEVQNFYHIKRVWHPCQGESYGMSYPTPGVITRWKRVVNYLQPRLKGDK